MTGPKVVAEYGQTMSGSIEVAHRQVDIAAECGCWGYKTQLLTPDRIARADAPLYWQHGSPYESQQEAFTRAGLVDYDQWEEVAAHANAVGLEFVATPFDLEAVDAMRSWSVTPVYKVASGDITNLPLLRAVGRAFAASPRQDLPLVVSTGASTGLEVDQALAVLYHVGVMSTRVVLLACTLAYPTRHADAELARIATLRLGGRRSGYSDHVASPDSALGAAVLGAELLEVHCTLNPGDLRSPVPDDVHALGPVDLVRYVDAAERGAAMRGRGELRPVDAEVPARQQARRSICAARDLQPGEVLAEGDLVCLRPADGISPWGWDQVVGTTVLQPIRAGARIDPALLLRS